VIKDLKPVKSHEKVRGQQEEPDDRRIKSAKKSVPSAV